jgi:hypothetical protein
MRNGVARVRLTSLDAPPPTIRSEPSSWRRVRVRRRSHHQARSRGSRSRRVGANPVGIPQGRS